MAVSTRGKQSKTLEKLTALPCPVERAAAVTKVARRTGTLPGPYAALRRTALAEARAAGHAVGDLARKIGLTSQRVSQLTAGTRHVG